MTSDFIFGTTSGSSGLCMSLLADKLRAGEEFVFIDPKASIYRMSKTKAKRRLMAAGLRPAEANTLVHEVAGRPYQGTALRAAMRHHKRHGRKWFPWDTLVTIKSKERNA